MTELERIQMTLMRILIAPFGLLFAVVSGIGFALAALAGPVAGALAWLAMPLRALARRSRT